MNPNRRKWLALGIVTVLAAIAMGRTSWAQGIDPDNVTETIADGESLEIVKTVHTPAIPPDADICFLADTTGSMESALNSVQAGIGSIMADVLIESPNAQFCAAQYKDTGDVFTFQLDQALTADTTAVQNAANGWSPASGGGDAAEDQLHALTEMAGGSPGWRPAPAAHILVWFGDCPGHDPASGGETLASTIGALTTSGAGAPIVVLGVSVHSTLGEEFCGPGFLDDTALTGGVQQATEVTTATSGVLFADVDEDAVAEAIAAALDAVEIPITVAMVSDCSGVVTTAFDPASQVVNAGDDAVFTETISVNADPDEQGQTYECDDWATINGEQMTDADGNVILEHKTITVPDSTPPAAACTPTTNPSGQKVPPAGEPKGNSGQNPDGFYELTATDNVDDGSQVFLADSGSSAVFGPFASGVKIKLTQAPGATPGQKPGPGVIDWHITINGDAIVFAVDASGNVSARVSCLVPPPPR
jgi:hypothetical protein